MADPIFERIGKALHIALDEYLHEPPAERWIDLINRLNAEDDAQRESADQVQPKVKPH